MDKRFYIFPPNPNRLIIVRKRLFCFFLIMLFLFPLNIYSKEKRGIQVTSKGRVHDVDWGNYYALIVGINKYKEWRPLQTAVQDAKILKEMLVSRYGFDKRNVILRTDKSATLRKLVSDLRNLASSLGSQDNFLIYFAGHGQLDDLTGDGYWIPVEGKLKDPTSWISHFTIKSILSSEKVLGKNIVLIADSCYSGSLLRGGPSLLPLTDLTYREKLAKVASKRSRQVITSGGVEPVADGGKDGHSLFAYYLLKALKENEHDVIDIENLFHTHVWKPVTEIGEQRPNVGRLKTPMDDDGQFVLIDRLQPVLEAERVKQAEERKHRERLRALEEERKGLEAERQLLESQKKVMEEKKRLETERLQLEKERQNLARLESEKKLLEEKKRPEEERQRIEKEKALLKKRKHIDVGKEYTTEENIKLASIDKSISSSTLPYQLAIFPWKPSRSNAKLPAILNRIIVKLQNKRMFTLKCSSYKSHDHYGVEIIDNRIETDKIWLIGRKPNVDEIRKLGKELKVDVILTGIFDGGDVHLFLIDVKTEALFSERNLQYISMWGGNWFDGIDSLSSKIAKKYISHFASPKTN